MAGTLSLRSFHYVQSFTKFNFFLLQVQYQLVNPSSFFLIDPSTGTIRSKDVLHYDITGIHNMYILYVEARDSGVPSHTSIASVNITILDANDHAPEFNQPSYFTGLF